MIRTMVLLISFLCVSVAHANYYTPSQSDKLDLAAEAGQMINGFPETMQAIILQESSAGKDKLGDDGKSLGLAHVTEAAAIDVFDYCKRQSHAKDCGMLGAYVGDRTALRLRLALDDRFNIVVASIYLKIQYQWFKSRGYSKPWTRAIAAYNAGRKAVLGMTLKQIEKPKGYVDYIHKRIRNVRKYR